MRWSEEAEAAVDKVPFFVRKKVRGRVEKEAAQRGKQAVSLEDVKDTQRRYLAGMASEVKGYRLDGCFGPNGCPNRAGDAGDLMAAAETLLQQADLLSFLKKSVDGPLKFHHEFRVTVAECPNACSRPQIKDVGIIAGRRPMVGDLPCTGCGECAAACPDAAVTLECAGSVPIIDPDRCLCCGKCLDICPSGTLAEKERGYFVLLGGKLGRHPRLARKLPGLHPEAKVLEILAYCIDFYKQNSKNGQRFAAIFTSGDFDCLVRRLETDARPLKYEPTGCCS